MKSLVKETRIRLGLSMEQLGQKMGTSATSVSSLERNEAAGTAKIGTVERALRSMGKIPVTFVLDQDQMTRIDQAARRIARSVETMMALEGQNVSHAVAEELYERALRNEMAKL